MSELSKFHLTRTDGERNLFDIRFDIWFDIWEDAGARGDSVTPSTYSREYRAWMVDKLAAELTRNNGTGLLSLDCGNVAVEGELVRRGLRVAGVDAMEEAVVLARANGVEAERADITVWSPDRPWPLVCMDGVLGHLYEPGQGFGDYLSRLRSWLAPGAGASTATFVASNDAPRNDGPVQPAPGVTGFHWLSLDYLREQIQDAGLDDVTAEHFQYPRPRSGPRLRAGVVARLHT
jgi:hypothetical protein